MGSGWSSGLGEVDGGIERGWSRAGRDQTRFSRSTLRAPSAPLPLWHLLHYTTTKTEPAQALNLFFSSEWTDTWWITSSKIPPVNVLSLASFRKTFRNTWVMTSIQKDISILIEKKNKNMTLYLTLPKNKETLRIYGKTYRIDLFYIWKPSRFTTLRIKIDKYTSSLISLVKFPDMDVYFTDFRNPTFGTGCTNWNLAEPSV